MIDRIKLCIMRDLCFATYNIRKQNIILDKIIFISNESKILSLYVSSKLKPSSFPSEKPQSPKPPPERQHTSTQPHPTNHPSFLPSSRNLPQRSRKSLPQRQRRRRHRLIHGASMDHGRARGRAAAAAAHAPAGVGK